jgi:hypothetical protein
MAETDLVREFDFDDVDIIDDSGNSVCARENDIAVGWGLLLLCSCNSRKQNGGE